MSRLLFALFIFFSITLNAQTIGVMSYNIRYANNHDGDNGWNKRKDHLAAVIQKYGPELMGTQEVLAKQLCFLKKRLKNYGITGVGRDDGKKKGEYSAIFYKKDSFELVAGNTFWLSETPENAGSKGWDAALPRIATWCKLKHKRTGSVVFVFNTHFDHAGKLARINSAVLIKQKIKEIAGDEPVILMGDFNTTASEASYRTFISELNGFALTDIAGANDEGTYCGFESEKSSCIRIDYIFCNNAIRPVSYAVPDDHWGAYYPSDHKPVWGVVELLHKP